MAMSNSTRRAVRTVIGTAGLAIVLVPAAQAGPFLAPQRVIDPIPNAGDVRLAVGSGGAAALSFQGSAIRATPTTPSQQRVYVAVHDQGQLPTAALPRGFKLAEPVSPAGDAVVATRVGVDAAGNTTVVYWIGEGDSQNYPGAKIYARYRPANGTWGAPQLVAAQDVKNGTEFDVLPELVVASDGRAALLTDAGLFDRAPGQTSFTAVPGTAAIKHIAANAAGNLVAVELGEPSPDTLDHQSISVRTRTAGRPFGAPVPLGVAWTGYPYGLEVTAVALTDSGTAVVAWDEGDVDGNYLGADHGLNVSVRTPGSTFATGTWATTQNVNFGGGDDYEGFHPAVQVDSASKATVRWGDYPPGNTTPVWHEQLFPGTAPATAIPQPAPTYGEANRGLRSVSVLGQGRALQIPLDTAPSTSIRAEVRAKAGEPFSAPQTVIAPTGSETYGGAKVGLDGQGNGYVAWARTYPATATSGGRTTLIGLSGYDPVSPVLTSVTAAPAKAGSPTAFVAMATDRMSVPKITWSFGDGTASVAGDTASHVYAKPGTYTARASAKDEAGNTTSWPKTVVVSQ